MVEILTCKLGNEIINCYDGTHNKEQFKKWASKNILLCPACNNPYEYCHGEFVSPYFRHRRNISCTSLFSEPETEEHIVGKRDLFEWIKKQDGVTNPVLEGWMPETKQRPDIMFEYNGMKCVIEYQCSPIASEYIKRHELYQAANIRDIWICGTSKYLGENKRLKELEKAACLYYDTKNKYIYKLENISEKEYERIVKMYSTTWHIINNRYRVSRYYKKQYFNRTFHVMRNVYDYTDGYKNYIPVKNDTSSYYCSGSYYPSPTGRPSNKYPYPVKEYKFLRNYTYAACYRLSDIRLYDIK